MGFESRIMVDGGGPEDWAQVVGSELQVALTAGVLHEVGPHDGMPDAFVKIEADHVYFCTNNAAGTALLERVERRLATGFRGAIRHEL
jgi:hypothetical protein